MFWFVFALLVLLIIAAANSPSYSLQRACFDESLETLNSAKKAKFVCGVISIIISLLPIIDAFLPKVEQGEFYKYYESPILLKDYSGGAPLFGLVLIWGFVIGWIIWMISNKDYKDSNKVKLEEKIKQREEEEAERAIQKKAKEEETKRQMSALTSQFGQPEKIINISDDNINNAFIVFPSSCSIKYKTQVISYSELVSSEIKDNTYTTTTGTKEEVTKSSTGSTIGRAVVGGLIAGPAGAIIGGATSKKRTEVIDNTRTILHHHYFVIVNLSTPANPVLKIDCGASSKTAEEINAILVGIIANQAKGVNKSTSIADELAKLAILREKGILTEEEFLEQKSRILGGKSSLTESDTRALLP